MSGHQNSFFMIIYGIQQSVISVNVARKCVVMFKNIFLFSRCVVYYFFIPIYIGRKSFIFDNKKILNTVLVLRSCFWHNVEL